MLPGVQRACDAYVEFVEGHDLLASVASSLTELAAGPFLGARANAFEKHYDWVAPEGLAYFRSRTTKAPRDAQEGLAFVLANAVEEADQQRVVEALERKCEILWSLLDGVEWGAKRPRLAPAARWQEEGLLVLPERAIRLGASAREILDACDGERCVDEVACEMRRLHREEARIERDVFDFLEQMERLGVLRLRGPEAPGERAAAALEPGRRAHLSLPAPLPLLLEPDTARRFSRAPVGRRLGARLPRGRGPRRRARGTHRRRALHADATSRRSSRAPRRPGSTPTW